MKKVTLKSLTLTNFRGEKFRTTEFRPDETTIMGGNGLGKSRHMDAFCWLLFGKDALDRKDFEVRTVVNGEPLHKVECSVTGVLDISGELVTLKRSFAEKRIKPRGQTEEVFKGNETEAYWNDVPVSVTEFQRRVSDIIPETIFKLVTSPLYFATQLKWQDQREQLFRLAGEISSSDIAAKDAQFAAFLDKVGGKSFADFKRELLARKKRLKDDLSQIDPKIEQTQKLMPESSDFTALKKQVAALEGQLADIDKAIADSSEAARQQGEAARKKQEEINDLKQQQQRALFAAQAKAGEAAHHASVMRRSKEIAIDEAERRIATLQQRGRQMEVDVELLSVSLKEKDGIAEKLRVAWDAENERAYDGSDICQLCGQALPESIKSEARARFEDGRQKKLSEIRRDGTAAVERAASLKKSISEDEKSLSKLKEDIEVEQGELAKLRNSYAELPPPVEVEVAQPSGNEEFSSKIAKLEEDLRGMQLGNPSGNEFLSRKKEIAAALDVAKSALRNRDLIAQYTAEISRLEEQGRILAQQIADAEKEEYVMQRFNRARVEECERRINGLFSRVTFKLFDYTLDGNEVETCIPMVDGVPFGVANTAGQLNAGVDIINALTKFYSVSAPIFVDRRESINELIETGSQIINLIVSNDKELLVI